MAEIKNPFSRIRRDADDLKRIQNWRKIIPPFVAAALVLLILVYIISLLFSRIGSFTISVKDFGNNEYSLSLAEHDDFKRPVSRLVADQVKEADNISYISLPADINDEDGSKNGDNWLAYTFYIKNTGTKECNFKYTLLITRATLGIDSAVRIRVYFNRDYYKSSTGEKLYSNEFTEYAKPKTGGGGAPEVDPGDRVMQNFVSDDIILEKQIDNFGVNDIARVTIVIWLEGDDPDCTDDILGGQFKTDMVAEIVGL